MKIAVITCSFCVFEVCLATNPLWRLVKISTNYLVGSDSFGQEFHTTSTNVIQCIQKCQLTSWCQLSCFEDSTCILSSLTVYFNHIPDEQTATKSCYTNLRMNFAVNAIISASNISQIEAHITRVMNNTVNGIYFEDIDKDCYYTNSELSSYVFIEMMKTLPVSKVSLRSQYNQVRDIIFDGITIYGGLIADLEQVQARNFDGLHKIGTTTGAAYKGQIQEFDVKPIKDFKYIVLSKPSGGMQVCGIIVN